MGFKGGNSICAGCGAYLRKLFTVNSLPAKSIIKYSIGLGGKGQDYINGENGTIKVSLINEYNIIIWINQQNLKKVNQKPKQNDNNQNQDYQGLKHSNHTPKQNQNQYSQSQQSQNENESESFITVTIPENIDYHGVLIEMIGGGGGFRGDCGTDTIAMIYLTSPQVIVTMIAGGGSVRMSGKGSINYEHYSRE